MVQMGLRMMADRGSPFGIAKLTDLQTLSWMARFALAGTRGHVERSAPLLRDLNLASRAIFERNVPSMASDVAYEQKGLLMLSRTQAAHDAESHLAEQANALGLRTDILSREDVERLEPGVAMDVAGAVYFRDDAHLTPAAYMRALLDRVRAKGGEVRFGQEVRGIDLREGRIFALRASEPLAADEYVLAAGAWSAELARTVGLKIPLRAGRGYGFTVPDPPQRMRIPTILTEARIAVTPMSDGVRFVGTLELTAPTLQPSSPRVDAMKRNVSNYYPAFSAEKLGGPVWCGLRPCPPDGMPYIGRTRRAGNLIVATGHAMMGMSLGPVTGQIVAALAANESPPFPLDLLNPDRYA